MTEFLTDGYHLYEIEARTLNYGRTGGEFTQVRDVTTGRRRVMCPLERAICRQVFIQRALQ